MSRISRIHSFKNARKPPSYASSKLWPSDSLTEVKCRATSVANKKCFEVEMFDHKQKQISLFYSFQHFTAMDVVAAAAREEDGLFQDYSNILPWNRGAPKLSFLCFLDSGFQLVIFDTYCSWFGSKVYLFSFLCVICFVIVTMRKKDMSRHCLYQAK